MKECFICDGHHIVIKCSKARFCLILENRILDEREEPGFLTGLKIPAPWAAGKTIETMHPVRDNYKFKETVHIPGARCLYLRFDPRCSSQYDYDKVITHQVASLSAGTPILWISCADFVQIFSLNNGLVLVFLVGYLCWSQHQQS